MPLTWPHDHSGRRIAHDVAEFQRSIHGRWRAENAMIGHHTEKRREDQFAHPESLWAVEMMLQPVAVIAMGAKSPSGDAEVIRAPR